jgi:hypothetical protein
MQHLKSDQKSEIGADKTSFHCKFSENAEHKLTVQSLCNYKIQTVPNITSPTAQDFQQKTVRKEKE